MKLPNAERAQVRDAKLMNYLLDLEHSDGGPKARFFFAMGFPFDDPEPLRASLIDHAETGEVVSVRAHSRGVNYRLRGAFQVPLRRKPPIVASVWFLASALSAPQLVTAFPY